MRTALISLLLGLTTSVWATPVVQPVSRQTSSTSIRSRTSSTSSRTHSFQPGTLDDIEFDATHSLGEGGFAKVYKGVSKKTHQPVAVKEMDIKQNAKLHGMSETDIIDFLKTEAKFSHSVHHPNVIQTSELFIPQQGPHKGKAYLLVEYCEKGDLMSYVMREKGRPSLTQKEAKCHFWQLMHGLQALHSQHIAHFDIKPDNLLWTKEGITKIADLGHAMVIPESGKFDEAKFIGGSREYWAPELFEALNRRVAITMGPKPVVEMRAYPVDVWAAAITYMNLNMYSPWELARTKDNTFRYYKSNPEYDFGGKFKDPEELKLLQGMLAIEPDRRPSIPEILKNPWFAKLKNECDPSIISLIH